MPHSIPPPLKYVTKSNAIKQPMVVATTPRVTNFLQVCAAMIPIDKCLSQSNKVEREINEAEAVSSVLNTRFIHLLKKHLRL